MRSKKIKKMLAITLAATMIMASAMTVCAADGSGGSGGSGGDSTSTTTSSESSSKSQGDDNTPVIKLADVMPANTIMTISGTKVVSTIAGAYSAKSVDGIAVITPIEQIKANLGLKPGQTPYIMIFDTDVKKSNLAMDSLNAAAEALGGKIVTSLNIDLGAKQNGKFITLSDGTVNVVVGLPKTAIDPAKTYSVVCVRPEGEISILEDQDTNPNTIMFAVNAGLGSYAIIVK